MKNTQNINPLTSTLKKQHQGQLKELIDSYCLQVGTDLQPIWKIVYQSDSSASQIINTADQKIQKKKKNIEMGRIILLSTLVVLMLTMIGIFSYQVILVFGVFWGFLFTKYEISSQHDLTEMVLFWMIFSLVICLENILMLGLFFLPFYHSLKLIFIISLLYPIVNLKSKIYKSYFLPRITLLSQNLKIQK